MEKFLDLFTDYDDKNLQGLVRYPIVGLVVLGNGFDIQCGLKTRYRQFFDYCVNNGKKDIDDKTFYSEASRILNDKTNENGINYFLLYELFVQCPSYSVWDLYFIIEKESHRYETWNWMDVEQAMQESLVVECFWDKAYPRFELFYDSHIKYDKLMSEQCDNIADVVAATLYVRYILNEESGLVTSPGETVLKIFYDALLRDLTIFEERFGKYIMNQYSERKDEYTNIAQENIATIYKYGLSKLNIDENVALLRVISFNYTPILDDDLNDNFVLYIHGLYDAPIFGISELPNPKSDPHISCYNMFSKDSRKKSYFIDNIKDILPQKYADICVFTYGLSFWNIDAQDFKNIIYDQDKHQFRNMLYMYPNLNSKTKEHEITKDIISNLDHLISKINPQISDSDKEKTLTESIDSVRLPMEKMP